MIGSEKKSNLRARAIVQQGKGLALDTVDPSSISGTAQLGYCQKLSMSTELRGSPEHSQEWSPKQVWPPKLTMKKRQTKESN